MGDILVTFRTMGDIFSNIWYHGRCFQLHLAKWEIFLVAFVTIGDSYSSIWLHGGYIGDSYSSIWLHGGYSSSTSPLQ